MWAFLDLLEPSCLPKYYRAGRKGGSPQRTKASIPRDTSICLSLSVNADCVFHPWNTQIMPHAVCPESVSGVAVLVPPSPYKPVLHPGWSTALTSEYYNFFFFVFCHSLQNYTSFFPDNPNLTLLLRLWLWPPDWASYPGSNLFVKHHQEDLPKTELNISSQHSNNRIFLKQS